MMLIDRLVRASEIWARENERSLSRLATIVVNDGKLFERISGGGSCTVATYERLMAHLKDPSNWSKPIPTDASALLDPLGSDSDPGSLPSSGNADEVSTEVAA